MKRYRTYTAKKYKVAKKVIFFVVVAIIIFALTVLLGNHLKGKVESADTAEPLELDTTAPVENDKSEVDEESVPHDEALAGVRAGYLQLFEVKDAALARSSVTELKAAGYDAVSFIVTDENGFLTYASPAVSEDSRLPASESLIPFEVLRAAAEAARENGMRLSCVITASDSISDEAVAGELAEIGFNEIIVRGFEGYTQLNNEYVDEIKSYGSGLRKAAGENVCVSVCFAPELFKAPQNAPYIEKLYNSFEFLSIDMTSLSGEEVSSVAGELAGSLSAYHLRPVLDGSDKDAMAVVDKALSDAGVTARLYISAPANVTDPDSKDD